MRNRCQEKRMIGLMLIPLVAAGALSTAVFAQPRRSQQNNDLEIQLEGEWADQDVFQHTAIRGSGSDALRASSSEAENAAAEGRNLLGDRFRVNGKQIKIGQQVIYNTDEPDVCPEQGMVVLDNTAVEVRLNATVPQGRLLGEGDETEIYIGSVSGLDINTQPGAMVLEGILIGYAQLCYTENGAITIKTQFADGIQNFQIVNIQYTFTAQWYAVQERTPVMICFEDEEREYMIYLEPAEEVELPPEESEETEPSPEETETAPEESETAPEETESSPEESETIPEETETAPEESETIPEETETTAKRPVGRVNPGSGSSVSGKAKPGPKEPSLIEEPTEESGQAEAESESAGGESKRPPVAEVKPPETRAADKVEETKTLESELEIEVKPAQYSNDYIEAGSQITYQINIVNKSDQPIEQLRIRDYIPDHTSFVSADGLGEYGVIAGKQHVTWNIESIAPGESVECSLSVKVFECIPKNHKIINRVYYQAEDKTGVNDPRDPEIEAGSAGLTVG